jgi:hypothetical protein
MQGSCLCGGVRVVIEGTLERSPEACHCTQCRKQSGHFLAAVNVRRRALTVHGSENVRWFQSSEKVQRGFCSTCGSTLFWNPIIEGYEWIAVAMGMLDAPSGMRLAKHTFVGDKGDYYDITDGLPQSATY